MANDTAIVTPNHIDSIIKEVRKPAMVDIQGRPAVLIPDGYNLKLMENLLPDPPRKSGTAALNDVDSFIDFVKAEGSLASCRIYADVDLGNSRVFLTAVMNDHEEERAHWRDYRATYLPLKSVEWETWTGHDGKSMTQADFATFLEDNVKDVATVAGMPSGAQMLALALDFEAKQEVIIKSAMRLQSGSVEFNYVDKEDDSTVKRMEVFQRFTLGLAPFLNGTAYQLAARLKYKHSAGKLSFWYELIRPDLVLQDATDDLIQRLRGATGFPVYYGRP